MAQENVWDKEYKKSKLLTLENKPQTDTVKFVKFLKKSGLDFENLKVLDLGSGTGRNSFYFSELGADVTGLEISQTAMDLAIERAREARLSINYQKESIGETLPFKDESFDVCLDVMSSNSLSEAERNIYLIETKRVLKPGGFFFVKSLAKEGDSNAKNLLKQFPGKEKDTYVLPDLNVVERVWTKEDFVETYEKYFTIVSMDKKTSYPRMNNRSYKRNFLLAYMKKNV